ncbi:type II toxin-antitoxin system PemK/MazF family toxin [Dolichospermum sp. ST_sed1]|nr:type II toxin-antitoxin system PemK/MazF family toxin [Dolichospermum sp. ST_sed1]MDD1423750.1 type II toxin-antitoxin system PemK/MazF family toxin [Dolichospermum sp. ST_sed9]MDD1432563.1 type II toxin-antitoxin system PemK/MazF family toxin [Dolichospermum sp. ST_sed6]MDD1439590.1 type II toxin-antitoxin system PemK/MazF family toxin [Dolichospermum sp. ST_sed3]MDD1445999.1 type II toxin-antitoxin system PemK/MazF family toxin [Dolichospermum sp. ST_sed8]MDD1458981.1 type II toxin-antito
MVDLKRGDIVLCDLNPVRGTEQAGIRPVVIVQIDQANKVSLHTNTGRDQMPIPQNWIAKRCCKQFIFFVKFSNE